MSDNNSVIPVIDVSNGTDDHLIFSAHPELKSVAEARRVEMTAFMSKLGVKQMRTQMELDGKVYRILVKLA